MSNEVNDLYNSLNTAAKYANLETIQDKLNKINAPMIAYPRTPAGINIATIKNNMIMILDRGSIL